MNMTMYEKHFKLTERPFSIAPDPRFLYMSQQHREALAHLLYGVGEGGGFVQLTGEVGTGKTTICRCLLEQMPENVDVALILNPRVTALELLGSLCDELHMPYATDNTSIKSIIDTLSDHLLETHAKGRRTVLIVDEAQNLSVEALEQVRLLTNLETTREKLLQIILIGQPELREKLARDDLRQLSQRITARFHLDPIHRSETAAYVRHRLQVCGSNDNIFSEKAIDLVQSLSSGVPRLINVICDRSMLGAFVEGKRRVDSEIVLKAATEVLPNEGVDTPPSPMWRWAGGAAAVLVFIGIASGAYMFERSRMTPDKVQEKSVVQERIKPQQRSESVSPASVQPKSRVMSSARDADMQTDDFSRLLATASPKVAAHAWTGLYGLWGYKSAAVTDEQACAQASKVGLHCLQGRASWALLQRYDRPVLLLLVAPEGRRVSVLIEKISTLYVRVRIEGTSLNVPLKNLSRYWLGEYRLLWKLPPGGSEVLRPGDRGADVKWLRKHLQQITGHTSIAPDPYFFDDGLKQQLQRFQRGWELDADGVAGARTFIYLNNASSNTSIPRLITPTGQG